MKYHIPRLHLISAASADAYCVSGSNASPVVECTVGPGVKQGKCLPGGVPSQACDAGTAPSVCGPGTGVMMGCLDGTIVS